MNTNSKPLRKAEIIRYDDGSYSAALTGDGRGVGGWEGLNLIYLGQFKTLGRAVAAIERAFKADI